ncbi:PDC sensor domain-containing protein [Paenibacillus rhizoplanae]
MRNVDLLSRQIQSSEVDGKAPATRTLIDQFMKAHPELEILTVGNEQGAWMKAPDPGKQDYDPRTRDWYKASMQNAGSTTIIDPFCLSNNRQLYAVHLPFAGGWQRSCDHQPQSQGNE